MSTFTPNHSGLKQSTQPNTPQSAPNPLIILVGPKKCQKSPTAGHQMPTLTCIFWQLICTSIECPNPTPRVGRDGLGFAALVPGVSSPVKVLVWPPHPEPSFQNQVCWHCRLRKERLPKRGHLLIPPLSRHLILAPLHMPAPLSGCFFWGVKKENNNKNSTQCPVGWSVCYLNCIFTDEMRPPAQCQRPHRNHKHG